GLNFKSLRRSFAVRLERSGISPSTIAYLLGHEGSAPEVTADHYLEKPLSLRLLEQIERGLTYNVQTDEIRWEHFKMLLHSQAGRGKRGRKSKLQLH
ncbi:integrase, partial [Pseudomonas stutzeri]|nr:integrase [Stutzerimonas stutzeri]